MIARPSTASAMTGKPPLVMWGICAANSRIARALTKPTMTVRGTNRMSLWTPSSPKRIWKAPVRTVAANMYSTPWSRTSCTSTSAIAPVAAEIIAGRPPANAMMIAMVTIR